MLSPVTRSTRVVFGVASPELTEAQRAQVGENFNRLSVLVAETKAEIRKGSMTAEVKYQLDQADYQFDVLRELVRQMVDGGIEDASSGMSRPATVADAEKVARVMSRTAQMYGDIAGYAVQFAPTALVKNVLAGAAMTLAGVASEVGRGATAVVTGLGALAGGVGSGAKALGWVMPVVILGAAGFGLYLLSQVAKAKAGRYARA